MRTDDLRSYYPEELAVLIEALGEKKFRAKQLFEWMHAKQASSYDAMTNLPGAFRTMLAEKFPLVTLKIKTVQESKADGTRKYLFELPDGQMIESVFMVYHHGNTVCISSQAGCRMGCRFCASAIGGFVRNLEPSEMLEQVYRIMEDTGERISNIVIMGTGEPLDNYENVMRFLRLVSHPAGLSLSRRNLTLSTCGIVPRIYDLAEEDIPVTLAVSLHAPNDEKRKALMPVANKYTIREITDACRSYFKKTGRRITFEYALVSGENDSAADAAELALHLRGLPCHVNLIPVNPVRERTFKRPDKKGILNFQNQLEKCGINVTIRREMGSDIDGACGQLRKRYTFGD